jgi:hypothetical protein
MPSIMFVRRKYRSCSAFEFEFEFEFEFAGDNGMEWDTETVIIKK